MELQKLAYTNLEALKNNVYPGRGIVIGQAPDGHMVQVYWIMGRSENSRNRIFVHEGDVVRTAAFDESKVEDPSLIIYNCARVLDRVHIVSNGDQTDTIFRGLLDGKTFEEALISRTFEPDTPNYTPRISGMVDLDDTNYAYRLSVIKPFAGHPLRETFCVSKSVAGIGHMISTYSGDGNPLPAFEGEPRVMPVESDIDEIANTYWDSLNEQNRVALMVKFIEPEEGAAKVKIINAKS